MGKAAIFGLTLCAAAAAASAGTQADQAYFAILVETSVMKLAGMPDIEMPELPPGVKLPAGVVLPGQANRAVNIRLWSPTIAPAGATATVTPPAGLKVGNKLNLDLYRPTAAESESGGKAEGGFDPDKQDEFTIKYYWGSSATVREGQPKIFTWKGLDPAQKAMMREQAAKAQQGARGNYFYKPNWTTGYWPTSKQPGRIDPSAALAGTYNLETTYTGNVSLDVPEGVNFLDPIKITSPNLANKLDFKGALAFQWGGVPGSLGTYAQAMGIVGKNTLIIWSSSEVEDQFWVDTNFMQMAEVRSNVAKKVVMGPDATGVTIPAGIFNGVDIAMMNMTAWGPGSALDKGQPLPRLQTKSTLQVMLGGSKMKF